MSKCDLRVVLDRPEADFKVGDEISGRVEVSVNANCTCNGLTITQRWRTHGRGNTSRGQGETQTLFTGDWYPGEANSYPFSFKAPRGPVTYHGHYLNVDWYLEAQADIPWALDPKAETEFLLELGETDPRDLEQLTSPITQAQKAGGAFFCVGLFLLPFILMGGGAFATGVYRLSTGEPEGAFFMLWGSIFGGVPLLMLGLLLRNTVAQRKLGPVEVRLEPNNAQPGDTVKASIYFQPRGDLELNKITATFKGQEVCVSGSGTNKTTHRHELFSEEQELSGPCRLQRMEDASFRLELTVPEDAPPSFTSPSNDLVWAWSVHIDIPRWPDWTQDVPLVVHPRRGASA